MSMLCGSVSKRVQKWDNASAWHLEFCQGGSFPPTLTLMSDTSVSLCIPLVPFQLLLLCWSPKGVSLSPKCVGPLRGDSWDSYSFFCHPKPHWFLQPELMGTYLPGSGTLAWVVWCGAGSFVPKVSFLIFIHHTCVWDHVFCISMSLPLLPIWMNVISLISWLSDFHTAQFSDNSGWYLFCSRVVIFFCGCSRRRAMFTYIHLDWKAFITILLALFLMVYLTPSWLFCDYQYVLQNLFNFSTQLSNTCPTISTLATTYLFSVFVSLFLFHSSVYFSF